MTVAKTSAGLLLYRAAADGTVEVLLVHPGGPLWANKDAGAWSIPKGEYGPADEAAAVAEAEFAEELGRPAPPGERLELGEVTQRGGKRVCAWAVAGDVEAGAVTSNTFEMQWPPRSGTLRTFPEVDRAEWFSLDEARSRILDGQRPLLDRLQAELENTS